MFKVFVNDVFVLFLIKLKRDFLQSNMTFLAKNFN